MPSSTPPPTCPRRRRASAEALANADGYYLFISSVSVVRRPLATGRRREPARGARARASPSTACSRTSRTTAPSRSCASARSPKASAARPRIVRPGLIVGPHDPTGRFTYWPHRVARGGEVLAPRPAREPGSVHRRARSRRVDRPTLRRTGRGRLQRGESRRDLGGAARDLPRSRRQRRRARVGRARVPHRAGGRPVDGAPDVAARGRRASMRPTSRARSRAGLTFRPLAETVRGTLDHAETTDGSGPRAGAGGRSCSPRGRLGSIPAVEGFDFVHRETVRFRDLDSLGHVNNAVFLTYLEEARIAYLAPLGAEATNMILARVEIDFRAPLRDGRRARDRRAPGAHRDEELRPRVRGALRRHARRRGEDGARLLRLRDAGGPSRCRESWQEALAA